MSFSNRHNVDHFYSSSGSHHLHIQSCPQRHGNLLDPAFHKKTAKRINELLFLVLSAVSAVVLTVLYSSIIIFVHKQKNSIHMASEMVKCRAKENRKVTCMLVMVVIVFYVVWIPYFCGFPFFPPLF